MVIIVAIASLTALWVYSRSGVFMQNKTPEIRAAATGSLEDQLRLAARQGRHEDIRRLVASGAKVNEIVAVPSRDGQRTNYTTALREAASAAEGASSETVRLLLELGADPSFAPPGENLLAIAVAGLGCDCHPGGDMARVRTLMEANAPLEVSGPAAARMMGRLAGNGRVELLQLLLDSGVSPHGAHDEVAEARASAEMQEYSASATAELMKSLGSSEMGEELLQSLEESFEEARRLVHESNGKPHSFEIPLHQASEHGCAPCVTLLVKAGADVNAVDSMGQTALFVAGSPEVVRALAAANANIAAGSRFRHDALSAALDRLGPVSEDAVGVQAVLNTLIAVGIPLVLPPAAGRDRLYDAAFGKNAEAVQFLLQAGHPVKADAHGRTPLHAICWQSDSEPDDNPNVDEYNQSIESVLTLLLSAEADIHARDNDGNTPLHEAAAGDGANVIAMRMLIAAGADVNATNNDGQTPLAAAYSTGFDYERFVPLLLDAGANPLIRDNVNQSAIDIAREMIRGENPRWRKDHLATLPANHPAQQTGWKGPAEPGDVEHRMLALMEKAAERFAE